MEILPPDVPGIQRPTMQEIVAAGPVGFALPGIHAIPSGHWWLILPGSGEAQLWLQGQELIWPRGVWFVIEDKYFHVLMDSDYAMQWLDGWDLKEKVIANRDANSRSGRTFRVIESRVVQEGNQMPPERLLRGTRTDIRRLLGPG